MPVRVAGRPPGGVGDAVEHVAGVVGDLVAVDVLVGRRGLRRLGRRRGRRRRRRPSAAGRRVPRRTGRCRRRRAAGSEPSSRTRNHQPAATSTSTSAATRIQSTGLRRSSSYVVVVVVAEVVLRLGRLVGVGAAAGASSARGRLGGGVVERAVRRVPARPRRRTAGSGAAGGGATAAGGVRGSRRGAGDAACRSAVSVRQSSPAGGGVTGVLTGVPSGVEESTGAPQLVQNRPTPSWWPHDVQLLIASPPAADRSRGGQLSQVRGSVSTRRGVRPGRPAAGSRRTAVASSRSSLPSSACGPSHSAASGCGCTSTSTPSAPTAIAARDSGTTRSLRPAAWLGSTMTGRWLVAWTAGTAEMSRVLRYDGLEGPDAALAQHDVEVAALGDVLRRHQPLLDGRGHAALEQHRPARTCRPPGAARSWPCCGCRPGACRRARPRRRRRGRRRPR